MVSVTPEAVEYLEAVRRHLGIERRVLRLDVAPDGGVSVDFVDEPAAGDDVDEIHGVEVCVTPEVSPVIGDAVVELAHSEHGVRLVLSRPVRPVPRAA